MWTEASAGEKQDSATGWSKVLLLSPCSTSLRYFENWRDPETLKICCRTGLILKTNRQPCLVPSPVPQSPQTHSLVGLRMNSPERLSDSVGAQVDDLHQVVSGAGEELGAVVVQIQRRDSAQQLQLPHYTLRSDTHTHTHTITCNKTLHMYFCADLMHINTDRTVKTTSVWDRAQVQMESQQKLFYSNFSQHIEIWCNFKTLCEHSGSSSLNFHSTMTCFW